MLNPGNEFVSTLRSKQQDFHDRLDRTDFFYRLCNGLLTREEYIRFLAQSRHFVVLSMPTLAKCGERLRSLGKHERLAELLFEKADEEYHHEVLLDNDIEKLGMSAADALSSGPGPWVNAYNAWIAAISESDTPAAYLGSAYVLEALAVHRASQAAKALEANSSIPAIDKATSFLRVHGEADVGHVEELENVLVGLDDPVEIESMAVTAEVTRRFYIGMMRSLGEAR